MCVRTLSIKINEAAGSTIYAPGSHPILPHQTVYRAAYWRASLHLWRDESQASEEAIEAAAVIKAKERERE